MRTLMFRPSDQTIRMMSFEKWSLWQCPRHNNQTIGMAMAADITMVIGMAMAADTTINYRAWK